MSGEYQNMIRCTLNVMSGAGVSEHDQPRATSNQWKIFELVQLWRISDNDQQWIMESFIQCSIFCFSLYINYV
jgi:hypothetical protein